MPQSGTIDCPWCQTAQMSLHQTSKKFADSIYWQCPRCYRISDLFGRDDDAIAVGKEWAIRTRYQICQS